MGNTLKRLQLVLLGLLLVLSALGSVPVEAASDKLLDLRMRRLTDLRIQFTGRKTRHGT